MSLQGQIALDRSTDFQPAPVLTVERARVHHALMMFVDDLSVMQHQLDNVLQRIADAINECTESTSWSTGD